MKKISLFLVIMYLSLIQLYSFDIDNEYDMYISNVQEYKYNGNTVAFESKEIYERQDIADIVGYDIKDTDIVKINNITLVISKLFRTEEGKEQAFKLHSQILDLVNNEEKYNLYPVRIKFFIEIIVNEINSNYNKDNLENSLKILDIEIQNRLEFKSESAEIKKTVVPNTVDYSQSTEIYRTYYWGSRGGCYYINSNGNKTYTDEKWHCNDS